MDRRTVGSLRPARLVAPPDARAPRNRQGDGRRPGDGREDVLPRDEAREARQVREGLPVGAGPRGGAIPPEPRAVLRQDRERRRHPRNLQADAHPLDPRRPDEPRRPQEVDEREQAHPRPGPRGGVRRGRRLRSAVLGLRGDRGRRVPLGRAFPPRGRRPSRGVAGRRGVRAAGLEAGGRNIPLRHSDQDGEDARRGGGHRRVHGVPVRRAAGFHEPLRRPRDRVRGRGRERSRCAFTDLRDRRRQRRVEEPEAERRLHVERVRRHDRGDRRVRCREDVERDDRGAPRHEEGRGAGQFPPARQGAGPRDVDGRRPRLGAEERAEARRPLRQHRHEARREAACGPGRREAQDDPRHDREDREPQHAVRRGGPVRHRGGREHRHRLRTSHAGDHGGGQERAAGGRRERVLHHRLRARRIRPHHPAHQASEALAGRRRRPQVREDLQDHGGGFVRSDGRGPPGAPEDERQGHLEEDAEGDAEDRRRQERRESACGDRSRRRRDEGQRGHARRPLRDDQDRDDRGGGGHGRHGVPEDHLRAHRLHHLQPGCPAVGGGGRGGQRKDTPQIGPPDRGGHLGRRHRHDGGEDAAGGHEVVEEDPARRSAYYRGPECDIGADRRRPFPRRDPHIREDPGRQVQQHHRHNDGRDGRHHR